MFKTEIISLLIISTFYMLLINFSTMENSRKSKLEYLKKDKLYVECHLASK
jgi:hypothetical protein